jgi:hypothetical protein
MKKRCRKCNEIKLLTQYNKDNTKMDGLTTRCKKCIYTTNKLRKPKVILDSCVICNRDFDDVKVNRCSRNHCKRCYNKQYNENYYKRNQLKISQSYKSSRLKEEINEEELEQLRIENKIRLSQFISDVKRKRLFIDHIDAFKMADLFEIYYEGQTWRIDNMRVDKQLLVMWDYLSKLSTEKII